MRFLLRFYLWLLLAVSGPLAVGYWLTDYAALAGQVAQCNFALVGGVVPLPLTPGRYLALQLALSEAALLALGGLLVFRRSRRRSLSCRQAQGSALLNSLLRPLRQLSGAERTLALGLALAVAATRLYYAAAYPLSLDEVASYDYSVLPGWAVTASYYPFPNNHLLANLLAGLVHALLPGASPALALRLLPTLTGLLAGPVVYALALRYLRFAVATLGLGLFALSPLPVYYAVAGRGYAWALLAALAGLFAALELLRPAGRRQLAWMVFGGSGVLGLYAVPTHLYALLGLGLGLLVGFGQQPARQRRINLTRLALVSVGIGVVAVVLYAPVGAVSGWPALLANRYVARHPWPEFRVGFGPFLVTTATELLGQRGLSAAAYLVLLALAPLALRYGRLAAAARQLGWLLYVQLTLWLPLAVAQGSYPPARTLLLVLLAFLLLLALSGEALLAWWQPAWLPAPPAALQGPQPSRWGLPLLALTLLVYSGYRLHREQVVIVGRRQEQQELRRAYRWLRRQPLRRIWVEPRAYAIFWHHYALSAGQPPLPLLVVDDALATLPGAVGEVEVLKSPPDPPRPAQPLLYQSAQVVVIPVSPTQPRLVFP